MKVKTLLLCGGQGTRIRDVSDDRIPKPMVPVGDRPILWHIMKHYAHHGFMDFILCLGHMGWQVKEYFLNYETMTSDFTLTLGRRGSIETHNRHPEEGWRVTMAETGDKTLTAGRLQRGLKYVEGEIFFATYGDGIGTVDLPALLNFHKSHGKAATLTGTRSTGRFGELNVEGNRVTSFQEKPEVDGAFINGGFFVFSRRFFEKYVPPAPDCDEMMLEGEPLQRAAAAGDLMIFRHKGFWYPMDTFRDWKHLNDLWHRGDPPWKTWKD